jgi:B-cell receptor-associated protein 31
MMRISAEAEAAKTGDRAGMHSLQTETNLAARKFYAQRNTYITGFTLFLSFVLTRTFYIVLDLIHAQEEYAQLKSNVAASSRTNGAAGDQQKTIADLQAKVKELEAKDRDFGMFSVRTADQKYGPDARLCGVDNLKKQAGQQAAEYDRLATKYNQATGQTSNQRKD